SLRERLKKIFGILLVVGLLLEIAEAVKADKQVAAANLEAKQAGTNAAASYETAAIAVREAGQANERASKFDAARAEFEKQSDELRSKNLELQKQLQPRTITLTQITNFIFLTEKIDKIPVKIEFAGGRNETANFAYQIRDMLNQAGFNPETNSGPWGINQDRTHITRNVGRSDTNWPSVLLYVYGTNDVFYPRNIHYEFTNGHSRPIVSGDDKETLGGAIMFAFKQIGISVAEECNGEIVKPGEFLFYIMDRAN
ncbi:MAG TPA: hypothetical protein VIK28_04210, partial [Sedimentisphaerales bacterium]